METLPPEVKGPIIRLAIEADAYEPNLWRYATISREWQALAEPGLFESLKLNPRRLAEALEIMTPLRQSYVRKIKFEMQLPYAYKTLDTLQERQASEALFSQLDSLLGHLHRWNMPCAKVELELFMGRPPPIFVLSDQDQDSSDESWINDESLTFFGLPLDTYRRLPQVQSITKVNIQSNSMLSPKTYCEIASRFPCLRTIFWRIWDPHSEPEVGRQVFAAALDLVPESVRDFSLSYSSFMDPSWPRTPAWLLPHTLDPLSLALRRLSMQLEVIHLDMDISSEFFSGSEYFSSPDMNPSSEEALWPRMREIHVHQGSYRVPEEVKLFEDKSGPLSLLHYSTIGESRAPIYYRTSQYYLIIARAAARMPNLRDLSFGYSFNIRWHYTASHNPRSAKITVEKAPVLVSGLQQDVEEAWCTAAKTYLGQGAELRFELEFEDWELTSETDTRFPNYPGYRSFPELTSTPKWTYDGWRHKLKWIQTV